jgi:hypothetical protein
VARVTGSAAAPDAVPPRSQLLAGLAVVTIVLYVVGSPFYIKGSLTGGDLWMIVALAGVLFSDTAVAAVLRLLRGAYGLIVLLISAVVLAVAFNATNFVRALTFAGQFLFALWVVIPVIAAGIADLRDPFGFLRRSGAAYVAFYALGLVLLFGAGSEAILYRSTIGRVFQQFSTQVFQLSLMSVGMAGTVFGTRGRATYLALLGLSLIPVLLNANRTGLASFALLGVLALAGTVRSLRQLAIVLVGSALLVGLGYAVMSSRLVQDLWQVRVLTVSGLLEDQIRVASVEASLAVIRRNVLILLFGAGWGSSGGDIVVHNFVIQTVHEGGLFVLLGMSALFALPVAWAFGARHGDRMTRVFVLMLTGIVVLFWSLNALVVERPYWLAYAVALGFAQRLRLARPPIADAASRAGRGLAPAPSPA